MTLIYLVQHGEKEPGPGDPGLTDTGREQAGRTARWLHPLGLTAVYSSPQRRAWQTGQIIAGVTVDLLRTLLGDRALPRGLLSEGVPACAVTTVHDLDVVKIASVAHLWAPL